MRILSYLALILLSACTAVQQTNFKDMSNAYREVIEQYGNDNILLNIVRASRDMPMSFLDIPSVVGSGSYTSTASITGTNYSNLNAIPRPSNFINGTLGMAINNTFSFTQASLDNATFMSSFLKEIPLEAITFQGSQINLPKSVIYSLLIENVELRTLNNEEIGKWINNPLSPRYSEFQDFLYTLIDIGLTTELVSNSTPIGPPISEADLRKNLFNWGDLVAKNKGENFDLQKIQPQGKDPVFYQLVKKTVTVRFCVNKYLTASVFGSQLGHTAYCANSPKPINTSPNFKGSDEYVKEFLSKYTDQKDVQLLIKLRSVANVFDFLGNVLNAQYQDTPVLVKIATSEYSSLNYKIRDKVVSYPLLYIYKNSDKNDQVARVKYRNDEYSIAENDGSFSIAVLEFLSMLLTISKTQGSIPASPAILVR